MPKLKNLPPATAEELLVSKLNEMRSFMTFKSLFCIPSIAIQHQSQTFGNFEALFDEVTFDPVQTAQLGQFGAFCYCLNEILN